MNLYYTEDLLTKILDSKAPFDNFEQEEACQLLVNELSDEDQEVAARTSYAYWYAATTMHKTVKDCLSPNIRRNMAMKEARRHLVGRGGDYDGALAGLQGSVDYRKEYNIDILRLCFTKDVNVVFASDEEKEQCTKYRAFIESELPKQNLTVRGRDKENRPIVIYMSRQEGSDSLSFDTEAFVVTRLYVVERAIAAVEFLSVGQEEKLTVFFRTGDYERANAPPFAAIKHMLTLLQPNYPERLKTFVMLDPPFWMRTLYSLIRIFLDEKTASKLVMVAGEAEKERELAEIVASDQAMPFMLSDGKLTSPIEPSYYLHQVPFYCPYDEAGRPAETQ